MSEESTVDSADTPETISAEPLDQTPTPAQAPESASAPASESAAAGQKKEVALGLAGDAENSKDEQPANEWLGVPEGGYNTDGIDLGEGVEVDPDVAEGLAKTCADLGISQKGFAELVNRMAPVLEKREQALVAKFRTENWDAAQKDPEIGGGKFDGVMKAASKAYRDLVPDDVKGLLKDAGLDTHPGLIKMFFGISQRLSPDSIHRGGAGQATPSLANFFNNSKMR